MLKPYLKRIFEIADRGDDREESYYSTLERLLEEYANSIIDLRIIIGRQFFWFKKGRGEKTRAEQFLKRINIGEASAHHLIQLCRTVRTAIGQFPFRLRPNVFRGIQLRSISREPFFLDSLSMGQKRLHGFSSMDQAPIPQQNNRTTQMTEQPSKKSDELIRFDVLGMNPEKQPAPAFLSGECQRRYHRHAIPPKKMFKDGRLAPGSPRPNDIRKQEKAAFIQKDQMGATSQSFFSSPASGLLSSLRWSLHRVPAPAVPASGSSIPIPSEHARYDWDDSRSEILGRSLRRLSAWSKDPSNNRTLRDHARVGR